MLDNTKRASQLGRGIKEQLVWWFGPFFFTRTDNVSCTTYGIGMAVGKRCTLTASIHLFAKVSA